MLTGQTRSLQAHYNHTEAGSKSAKDDGGGGMATLSPEVARREPARPGPGQGSSEQPHPSQEEVRLQCRLTDWALSRAED